MKGKPEKFTASSKRIAAFKSAARKAAEKAAKAKKANAALERSRKAGVVV